MYYGKCYCTIKQADAYHRPQQNPCCSVLRRVQGVFPGECGGVFCELVHWSLKKRAIRWYLVLFCMEFVIFNGKM